MKINKTAAAVILAVVIVIQLAVPCCFYYERNRIESEGTTYLFEISWAKAETDSKIEIEYVTRGIDLREDEYRYLVFTADESGVATPVEGRTEKPSDGVLYIKSASAREFVWPVSVYRTENATEISQEIIRQSNQLQTVYGEVKIYHGRALLTGIIFSDGTRA